MTLIVNGVNLMQESTANGRYMGPFVALEGYKWQRSDVDGPGAGRQLDGDMRRDRIGKKRRIDVTCRPLYTSEAHTVLQAIDPDEFSVTYEDPQMGVRTCQMYSNNYSGGFKFKDPRTGAELWAGITFPLIEL